MDKNGLREDMGFNFVVQHIRADIIVPFTVTLRYLMEFILLQKI